MLHYKYLDTNYKDRSLSNKTENQNTILKEMINSSWSGIGIINLDTKFLYINKAFSPLLGYSQEDLLDIFFIDLVSSEDKEAFKTLIKENAQNKYINNIQLSCIRKDGGAVFLDITISFMKDEQYIVIDASDITQTISEHEIYNKYLIQTQIDTDGNIQKASEAYCRMSGYTEKELIGTPYTKYQNEENKSLWNTIKNSEEYSGTIINKTKAGTFFWVESVIKSKSNKYGDIIGYTAVMFDITNEMTLEEKKKDLIQQIVDKDAKLNIMTDTMRLVAHEWRQPLNVISLEVQNVLLKYQFEEEVATDDTIEFLTDVTKHIEDLSDIINNFQNTTEITETKVSTTIDIIIEKALLLSQTDDNTIVLEDNFKKEFTTYMGGISSSISHIIQNAKEAISNSNTPDTKIKINIYEENDNIIFEIINIGNHIPEDIIETIFTPYFSTKETRNGVGLSLYKCKMIIELHLKGSIDVVNTTTDNKESAVMFKIILPLNLNEDN